MTHTPGPWHQGKDKPVYAGGADYLYSLHIYAAPRTEEDNETDIAWVSCRDDDAQGCGDAPRLSQATANARLIAAAPDLLAALKETLRCFDLRSRGGRVGFERNAYDAAKAAIAKAEAAAP